MRASRRFAIAACLGLAFLSSASLRAEPSAAALPAGELTDWCRKLSTPLPGIRTADCLNAELRPSGGKSTKGFPLLMRQYQPNGVPRDKAIRVLLLGGIHGDELTASAIVFQWLKFMPQREAQQFHWTVVPAVNPDGILAPQPRRTNANGVDLNRNFPTPGWDRDARSYWQQKTRSDPRRFPGKSPLSEPETRWLNDEMERFHPQVIISVHAPFGVLDFDGPADPPKRFGRLLLNPVGVYPGSLGNYSGKHKNVPVITIELPNARAMPPEAEVRRIWDDMLVWIRKNVNEDMAEEKAKPLRTAVTAK